MTRILAALITTAAAGVLTLASAITEVSATPPYTAPAYPRLAEIVAKSPAIKSASSTIVPTTLGIGSLLQCKVNLLYGENPDQNVNIVVALPLNAADGDAGRVQGAWNGRTQSLGGGECSGNLHPRLLPASTVSQN
jgi:hypothetical protein